MRGIDYIKNVYKNVIDVQTVYAKCISSTTNVKMSRGNVSDSQYGLYPPDRNIYILMHSKNCGHLTKKEKRIDFKYYFNSDGKVILLEHYNSDSHECENELIHRTYFCYRGNVVDVITCDKDTSKIVTVAKCEFDNNEQLIYYVEGDAAAYPIGYRELVYEYFDNNVLVTYNTFYLMQEGGEPRTSSRKYLCRNNKIIKQL